MKILLIILTLFTVSCVQDSLAISDDATIIQEMIDSAIVNNQGVRIVTISGRQYNIARTIVVSNVAGLIIKGESQWGAKLIWIGNSTDPMFLFQDVRDSTISDLQIAAQIAQPLAEGIRFENGPLSIVVPTSNTVKDITIQGTNGGIGIGIRWRKGAGGDANNEKHKIYNVVVTNYTDSAFKIEHSQSKSHYFYNSQFASNGFGNYGVYTDGGSFHWMGGGGGGNLTADFHIGRPHDAISIINGNFENSNRFLTTAGASRNTIPTMIQGNRWSSLGLNADNIMIYYKWAGPLMIVNNRFGEGGAGNPITKIKYTPGGAIGSIVSKGNAFISEGSTPENTYELSLLPGSSVDITNNFYGNSVTPLIVD